MINIAVFASGYGSNFLAILEAITSNQINAKCELLVTDHKEANCVKIAKSYQIPIFIIDSKTQTKPQYEMLILEQLKTYNVELIVLAGYMRILSPMFIQNYPDKIINIHPSYLPNHKGKDAIKQAFESKSKTTGVSIHYVNEYVDDGEIIAQVKVPILESDTLDSLTERIHEIEHELYPQTIKKIVEEMYEKSNH